MVLCSFWLLISPNSPTPACLCQHASTDDAGMSKQRLSPCNAYHNWLSLNFTASDSSSDKRCFLKVLIVLQLTQLTGSKFQLAITLLSCLFDLENAYFLTFSSLFSWTVYGHVPFYHLAEKNHSGLISYFLLTILNVSNRSTIRLSDPDQLTVDLNSYLNSQSDSIVIRIHCNCESLSESIIE